jgi:hypothetical protein
MKRNLFLFVFLIVSINLFAQEKEGKTYRIIQGNNNPDLLKYKSAFEKAHWDCYRTKSKPREIKFDNGIVFELFSALELSKSDMKINTSCLTNEKDLQNYKAPIYKLADNGRVMGVHEPANHAKNVKIK